MRSSRRPLALLLGLALGALAQEPSPGGLAGRWVGSAKFQTETDPACRYEGGSDPPSLTLELDASGTGRLHLELPAPEGSACPPITFEAPLSEVALTPTTAAFQDTRGRTWNLALQAGVLRGLFAGSDGSGELALERRRGAGRRAAKEKPAEVAPTPEAVVSPTPAPVAPAPVAASPAAAPTPSPAAAKGPGLGKGALGIAGANVIALGALLAANKATQDNTAGSSSLVCSPRTCVIGGPGQPCDCSSPITTGQACGQTTSGTPIRGACSVPDTPCQALLSCNNGVCEDRLGSCPF